MLAETRIRPLVHNDVTTPGGLKFSASCFAGDHWSLRKLRESGDAERHATFAEEVGSALSGLGVRRAYAPNPTEFNGKIIDPKEIMLPIVLPYGVILYRNTERPADATYLEREGDAGVFSAGGCGMMVIACGGLMLFAHAGRESLLDRGHVSTYGRERGRPFDLVDNIVDALLERRMSPREIYAWPMYFIKSDDFLHRFDDPDPAHAAYNKAAAHVLPQEFGSECGVVRAEGISIDLPKIARAQFVRRGVPGAHVFLDHAYLADELPTTRKGDGLGRYLVAAVRH